MFDPLLIFLVLFGGALVGLVEALIRRRGLLQALVNIVFGTACGIAATTAVGKLVHPGWPLAGVALYLAPIVGSMAGILFMLALIRRERWSTPRELANIVGGFMAAVVALAVIAEAYIGLFLGSTRYALVRVADADTLAADTMAGANRISLALVIEDKGGAKAATLTTPAAAEIIAANDKASIGGNYRLRLINRSDNVTWTIMPGEQVSLVGAMTIAPNAWCDFTVRRTPGVGVSMESTGTGECPKDTDASRCAL